MKKLVQVNVTAGCGSTGVIAEEIGAMAVERGWESWIAYGREPHRESASKLIRIGSDFDMRMHGLESRLLDNHGLASRAATRRFVRQLDEIKPDVVHLHNIHGYYLNYPILFRWLKVWGGPVVWTLHDCWPFTGHCAHFMFDGCEKWRSECKDCSLKASYPASLLADNSRRNYNRKKTSFLSVGSQLRLVACSDCVADYTRMSFFKDVDVRRLHNGVDLRIFRPSDNRDKKKRIIGVASVWSKAKGLDDFVKLRSLLSADYEIVLVGLTAAQRASLPSGITGIERTADRNELAKLYAEAAVFVNPTYEDNFPTVNIEALACGTPVVTYRTGGSPEAVDEKTGVVVEQGDIAGLVDAIERARGLSLDECRKRAEERFDKNDRYADYIALYERLLNE